MLEGAASAEQTTAWDMEKRVWFDMPFKEINCRIYLGKLDHDGRGWKPTPDLVLFETADDLLPRMIDLSENSPDRKTKVAATELLHACVLVMIGRSAKQLTNVGSGETKKVRNRLHGCYRLWLIRNSIVEPFPQTVSKGVPSSAAPSY